MTIRKTMIRCLFLGAAILMLVNPGIPAAAAEEEAGPTPAERFRAVIEKLPEPKPEQGYSFTGNLFLGKVALGEFRFSAEMIEQGGQKFWKTVEGARIETGGTKFLSNAVSLVDARLAGVKGSFAKEEKGVATMLRWSRTEKGFRIVRKSKGEEKDTEETVEGGQDSLPGLAAFLLFCRMAPAEPAEYKTQGFDPDPSDGTYLEPVAFQAKGPGEWKGRAALVFTRVEPDRQVTIALDPESRDILGMRMERDDGVVVDFLSGAATAAAGPLDEFTPPGKSPKQAALIIALAYGSANGDLLDRMTHWPSVVADLKSRYPGKDFPEEALRTTIRARLDAHRKAKGREEMVPVLSMVEPQLEVEMKGDDRATVRFPAVFQNLVLELGKFGSEWRLVVIPGT